VCICLSVDVDTRLELFGSSSNGLGAVDSDLDVAIHVSEALLTRLHTEYTQLAGGQAASSVGDASAQSAGAGEYKQASNTSPGMCCSLM